MTYINFIKTVSKQFKVICKNYLAE